MNCLKSLLDSHPRSGRQQTHLAYPHCGLVADASVADKSGKEVCRLHGLGWSSSAIARYTGSGRDIVRPWLQRGHFPEYQARTLHVRELDAHYDYLGRRWAEGCRNARRL